MTHTPRIINLEITSYDENMKLEVSATLSTGQRFSTFLSMPQNPDDLPTAMRFAGAALRNTILDELENVGS